MEDKLAFIGMGLMGGPMAANLASKYSNVWIWNRTPNRPGETLARSAGGRSCQTLEECVTGAAVVFTCLGDVPDVEEVVVGPHGIIQHLSPGSCVVDTSTIGPKPCLRIASVLSDRGIGFLDAPVSGGDKGAREATLTFMVGGPEELFEACRPYLAAMGSNLFHCGPTGRGQALKMCNQILCALHALAFSEALALAEAQGLPSELLTKVCATGAGGSWALSQLAPQAASQHYEPGFMIRHMRKDLALVLKAASGLETTQAEGQVGSIGLPGTKLVSHLYDQLVKLHSEAENQGTQALYRLYSE